jgi:hypothetical protein
MFGLEPNLIELVSADILITKDAKFYVGIPMRHPKLKDPDLARLVLQYYAKVLFNFGSDPAGKSLRKMMNRMLEAQFEPAMKVFARVGAEDSVQIVKNKPLTWGHKISATLYFVDVERRHIVTQFSKTISREGIVFSVPVLLQAVAHEIDEESLFILNCALLSMHAAYDSGLKPSTLENLAIVPNQAYLQALDYVYQPEKT